MRIILVIVLCVLAFSNLSLPAEETSSQKQESVVEEIVIRISKPAASAAQPAQQPEVRETKKEEDEKEPQPPEPPALDAAEPRRLVRYFCKAWKDGDYVRMYWAMTPQYRQKMTVEKFVKRFQADKEYNGGIVDENIVVDDVQLDNGRIQVTVDLRYKFRRVGIRRVKAIVEKQGGVYRLCDSGIIPLDMDDL
ncbi:MAG: hypothetical protein IKS83_09765 [Victivallales bacterium]|nr:hypothetical protein [Victivallales bacterium]MBR6472071.1 hypothetical protein [Victivallales bacterium]